MPFFPKLLKEIFINNKNTLQVRILQEAGGICGKRVFLSAFPGICGKRIQASFTVEAALVLPLFLFTMVLLMMPMKIMDDGRDIQVKLETVGEELSQYAYLIGRTDRCDDAAAIAVVGGHAAMLAFAEISMRLHVKDMPVSDISFWQSDILSDGETIDLIMNYRYLLPFPVLHISEVRLTARSTRRAWTGRDGKGSSKEGNHSEEMVYLGRDGIRYHKNRECHYLYNHIETVAYEGLDELRNQGGSRYHPCSRCSESGTKGGNVYVMPYGENFHSDRNCTAIIAYVKAVPLSEAVSLGPCSYCSQP